MAKKRQCLACSTKYYYCPDCSNADKLASAWKSEFCSEQCATLWTTLTKYNMSMLSKQEAKDIILNLELKPTDAYVACVQRDLKVVLAEEPKPKRGKRAQLFVLDEVIPEDIVEEVQCAVVDEDLHEVVLTKESE